MNIANILPQAAARFGDLTALQSSSGESVSFGELLKRVRQLTHCFAHNLQLKPGDRVAIFMENRMAYPEILIGAWHAGLVVVPVNAKLHAREFEHILESCGARIAFLSKKTAAALSETCAGSLCNVINVDDKTYEQCFGGEEADLIERASDDLAWLFYTSGTTGKPKGAMQSHRNLRAMLNGFLTNVKAVKPGQAVYHGAPMSHGGGYYILPFVANGGYQVIPDSGGFDVEELCQILSEHKSVSFFAAPTMVKRLLDRPDLLSERAISGLDNIIYGGGPMYLRDLERAHEIFGYKLVQIYGQGECPMTITALSNSQHQDIGHPRYRNRLSSVGQAQSGIEIRIVEPSGKDVRTGETGEILVRGDAVMLGYWNNPEATASTLSDGWLHTGDVGHLDEDGFLYLTDRSKDVIISGGSNIYPREVEEVLLRHPDIKEVSVIGVPDSDWGERVVACIATSNGEACSTDDLSQFCATELARFKLPKEYRFFEELPKNATGKILKTVLRETISEVRENGNV